MTIIIPLSFNAYKYKSEIFFVKHYRQIVVSLKFQSIYHKYYEIFEDQK